MRMLLNERQHLIDLFFFGTNHQGGVTAAQETARTGKTCRPEIFLKQRIHYGIGVFVLDNSNDQLFHDLLSNSVIGRAGIVMRP
jgi:hypothetical protein